MNNVELFQQYVNKLQQSPVFAMSLASKELFHSNFWAYLMEQDETKSFVKLFFPKIKEVKSVKREDKNRDITIYDTDDNEYVIENKIKSYPREEQLKEYQGKGKFACGVITGITEPPFTLPNWMFISYKVVSEFLKKMTPSVKNNYLVSIINDYCDVLDSIDGLLRLSLEETKNKLSYWTPTINKLNDIRIMDVFRKNKADDFVVNGFGKLDQEYKKKIECFPGWHFFVERAFNNGKATLSFTFKKFDKNQELESIGVQIEDNQFRIFKHDYNLTSEECFNKYKNSWFETDFDKKTNRKIRGFKSKMTKKYCQYGDRWIYQYFNTWIDNEQNLQDYSLIKEIVIKELNRALELIKKEN